MTLLHLLIYFAKSPGTNLRTGAKLQSLYNSAHQKVSNSTKTDVNIIPQNIVHRTHLAQIFFIQILLRTFVLNHHQVEEIKMLRGIPKAPYIHISRLKMTKLHSAMSHG